MWSKDNLSCARMQAGNFSKLPQSGDGTKWTLSFVLHGVFILLGHGLCIQ